MKSQAITILSIVGVLGTGVAAMAVNSDVLSSAVQSPVGKTSESLLVTPTADPTAPPVPSATAVPLTAEGATPGAADDASALPGSDDRDTVEPSAQPATGSKATGTRTESESAQAPSPAPVPVAPAVIPAPTAAPHVEDSHSHETETHETGATDEKDD